MAFVKIKSDIIKNQNKKVNLLETIEPRMAGFGMAIPSPKTQTTLPKEILKNRKKIQQICYERYKIDPLAGIIVNMTVYFVFGRGLIFNFNNDDYNRFMQKSWRKNKMPLMQKVIGTEGEIYGEVYIKLKVYTKDEGRWKKGEVALTLMDPAFMDIDVSDTNASEVEYYITSFTTTTSNKKIVKHYLPLDKFIIGAKSQKLTTAGISKDSFGNKIDLSNDECILHIKFNAVSNDVYGWSDLVRITEWLDNYQEYLRDAAIINKLYRSPFLDIEIESDGTLDSNGNDKAVSEAATRYKNWEIGANIIHNQKEKWLIKEFQTKSVSDDGRRGLLLMICAGVGFPEYMLSDGSNANLATARTQQLPAVKRFADKQDTYEFIFSQILEFKIQTAAFYGLVSKAPENDEPAYIAKLSFPKIVDSDDEIETKTTLDEYKEGIISKFTARNVLGRDNEFEIGQIQKEMDYDITRAEIKNAIEFEGDFDKARKLWVKLSDDIESQIMEMSKKVKNKKNEIVIQS